MTYKKSQKFSGRVDGMAENLLRIHQKITYLDLNKNEIPQIKNKQNIVLLEFAVDEGVRRNNGRVGAKTGSAAITKALSGMPFHFADIEIFHGGVISCKGKNLEQAQEELGFYVEKILSKNALPIVFGGGHEIAFGHYLGLKEFCAGKKLGIINFDAHFDLREIDEKVGGSSGTPFLQIAAEQKKINADFNYLVLGIQKFSNTKKLFEKADELKVQYVFGDEFNFENKENLLQKIRNFIAANDVIYLTICMDVFAAAFAPGVSAPSANGILPDFIFKACFDEIIKSQKLLSLDFAETNALFDIDNRTAKLAASLAFRVFENLSS